MRRFDLSTHWRLALAGLVLLTTAIPAMAQDDQDDEAARERGRELFRQSRGTSFVRNSDEIIEVLGEVVGDASRSTVKIMSGRRQIALGTVVSADGYLITKASELKSNIVCRLGDGTDLVPQIVGIEKNEDIALLKIDYEGMTPIAWAAENEPRVGSWLVSVGTAPFPLGYGVVSVGSRHIPPPVGVMGVFLEDGNPGALITQVIDGSPADQAGLQVDDVVMVLDGQQIADRPSLQELVRQKRPGETIRMTIQRGDEALEKSFELGNRQLFDPSNERSMQQNELGGPLNDVREGFTLAIQHDAGIAAHECGGPVVGIDGSVVGINIARAGRVKTYVLPTSILIPVIDRLKSGEFPPSIVNKDRIERLSEEISSLQMQIDDEWNVQLAAWDVEIADLNSEQDAIKEQIESGELPEEDGDAQIDALEERIDDIRKQHRPLSFRIRRTQNKIKDLQSELEFLSTGLRG